MLHEVVLALTVVLLPQEQGSGVPAAAADSSVPAAAGMAARSVVGRAPLRFTEAAPALLAPGSGAAAPSGGVATLAGMAGALSAGAPEGVPADTPGARPRPRAIVYSDWYARRLAIHRVASYTLLPLLAAQYYTGSQLMAKGSDAPLWVIRSHAPLATAAAAVFGVNTVTGVWNMWEARNDPNGSGARTAHGLLMLAADAGFLAAGAMGHPSVQNGSLRSVHRTVALSSMAVALVGYAIMLPPFRK